MINNVVVLDTVALLLLEYILLRRFSVSLVSSMLTQGTDSVVVYVCQLRGSMVQYHHHQIGPQVWYNILLPPPPPPQYYYYYYYYYLLLLLPVPSSVYTSTCLLMYYILTSPSLSIMGMYSPFLSLSSKVNTALLLALVVR